MGPANSLITTSERNPSSEDIITELRQNGVGVLRAVIEPEAIDEARQTVLSHTALLKNTRPTKSARHLAGFHQFPVLEPLHQLITGNQRVQEVTSGLLGADYRTIGLSDITMNRSQQWHKDLLRGRFRHYVDEGNPCELHHGKLFKVIVYLQDSSSLHYVPGSHRHDISLESDHFAVPGDEVPVKQITTRSGDAVFIDICTTHRGSTEEACQSQDVSDNPRILISTVFGRSGCDFAERMELGNAERLSYWRRSNP